ncbi:MAG: WD40 repeat domain-containing protein [Chloroflexota bacterium]
MISYREDLKSEQNMPKKVITEGKMKRLIRYSIPILIILFQLPLAGCTAAQTPEATPGVTSTLEISATATSTLTPEPTETLTPTQTNTPTITLTPTITPTPVPQVISLDNLSGLKEMFRFGKGKLEEIAFWPDQDTLAVVTQAGIYFYEYETLEEKRHVLAPAGNMLFSAALHPDGHTVASANQQDQKVMLWDANTGEVLRQYNGGEAIDFSSDGKLLASGNQDRTYLWSLETGKLVRTFDGAACDVKISPDGKSLATLGCGGSGEKANSRLWDLESGELLKTISFPGFYDDLFFSPDGRYLAVNGYRDITLWDVSTMTYKKLSGHNARVGGIAFSPDSRTMASAIGYDREAPEIGESMLLWDLETGKKLKRLQPERAYALLFSPDSTQLISMYSGVKKIDIEKNAVLDSLWDFYYAPGSWLPTGQKLLLQTVFEGKTIERLWDFETSRFEELQIAGSSLGFSPDGSLLAALDTIRGPADPYYSGENVVYLYDVGSGKLVHTLKWKGMTSGVISPEFSPDGALFAYGGRHMPKNSPESMNYIRVWDTQTGELYREFNHKGFNQLAFSSDGQMLATVGSTQLKIWDLSTGEALKELFQAGEIDAVAISPDGNYIATGSKASIEIWDARTFEPVRSIKTQALRLSFSEGSPYLFSVSWPGSGFDRKGVVETWNTNLWQRYRSISPGYNQIQINPKGMVVSSARYGQGVQVWSAMTGEMLKELDLFIYHLYYPFSADGRFLAFASYDGTVRVFGVPGK